MRKKFFSSILSLGIAASAIVQPISTFAATPFVDTLDNVWYTDGIDFVYNKGIMTGTDPTHFNPSRTMDRAMLVTVLHRLEGSPESFSSNTFSDVVPNAYYTNAVRWANEKGIVTGYDAYRFGPSDPISREQMATMLLRYAKYKNENTSSRDPLNDYTDKASISSYALEPMQWAVSEGIITGMNPYTLNPQGTATRVQTATILYRYLKDKNLSSNSNNNGSESIGGNTGSETIDQSENAPSIIDVKTSNGQAVVTLSINQPGSVKVEILNETFEEYKQGKDGSVIASGSANLTKAYELEDFTVSLSGSLPQYYIIKASLYSNSNHLLGSPYYSIEHTQVYRDFDETTVNDLIDQGYEPERIINFDNQSDENIGVLSDDIKMIKAPQSTISLKQTPNEYNDEGEILGYELVGYLISNPTQEILSLHPGDKAYITDSTGQDYLFGIGQITNEGSDLLITEPEQTDLDEYYDFLKVDGIPEENQVQTYSNDDEGWVDFAEKGTFGILDFSQHIDLKSKKFPAVSLTGKAECKVGIDYKIIYDIKLFGEDYYQTSFITKKHAGLSLTLKASNSNMADDKTKQPFLYEAPLVPEQSIPTPIPGVVVKAGLTFPVDLKLAGEVGVTVGYDGESGFINDAKTGTQKINSSDINIDPIVKANLELKLGPKAKAGIEVVKAIKVSLTAQAGVELKTNMALADINNEAHHQCSLCLDGEADYFIEADFILKIGLSEKLSFTPIDAKLVSFTASLILPGTTTNKFYLSIVNNTDSPYKGIPSFGFGECRNIVYLTEIKNTKHTTNPVKTTIFDENNTRQETGILPVSTYLYPGKYGAEFEVNGRTTSYNFEVKKATTVKVSIDDNGNLSSGNSMNSEDDTTIDWDPDWNSDSSDDTPDSSIPESESSIINSELYKNNASAVSAGGCFSVGLKRDGTVIAIGKNDYGQCNVSDWKDIISISAGGAHTVGLKKDGTVVATGNNKSGECDVSDWDGIVAISAGPSITMGLKKDGTVVVTGSIPNKYDEPDWKDYDVSDWKDIVSISAETGLWGVKSDGSVVGNRYFDSSIYRDITKISAGVQVVGLKKDGTIAVEGNPLKWDLSKFNDLIDITSNTEVLVGLKKDGTIQIDGFNNVYEWRAQYWAPLWRDVTEISLGFCTWMDQNHLIGLRKDGKVYAQGWNDSGQCNVSDWNNIGLPN